jgi:hypothetical protein
MRQQDCEFLSSHTTEEIGLPDFAFAYRGALDQNTVAGGVTVRIVYGLEVVQIEGDAAQIVGSPDDLFKTAR